MSTKLRELTVADFVLHARDEWECRKAGPFSIYRREVDGPPHWKLACGAYGKGMARAFVGMEPFGNMRLLKKVFGTVQTFLGGIGLNASPAANVNVLLWDPLFPLPPIREAAGRVDVISPETIARFGPSPSTLILLPTHRPGLHGGDVKRWPVSSAIHEGFHALLWDWLGAARTPKMRKAEAWKKFDEMCAVTLEYILAAKRSAWLDYGRAWQASMALSHNINDWPAFLPPGMAGFEHPVNVEEYGHFPFLAWMDEVIWPRHPRVGHWLVLTWEEGKKNGWTADPWEVLDKALKPDGGLKEVFRQYLVEAVFPSSPNHVLAQLVATFGPAPAVMVRHGEAARGFVIGPLSAQYLRCEIQRGHGRRLKIVDGSDRGADVMAFWVGGEGRSQEHVSVGIVRGTSNGKARIWEIRMDDCPAEMGELLVIVARIAHNWKTVAFKAEVV